MAGNLAHHGMAACERAHSDGSHNSEELQGAFLLLSLHLQYNQLILVVGIQQLQCELYLKEELGKMEQETPLRRRLKSLYSVERM